MNSTRVGLIGATSLVGGSLLELLPAYCDQVVAFTRQAGFASTSQILWRSLATTGTTNSPESIEQWISVAPIWVLADHLDCLDSYGARKVVVLSSTSALTKEDSPDASERETALKLREAELQFRSWAEKTGTQWVILRPTLIYGRGRDKNLCEIYRVIKRLGFFPLLGDASGLRQPIHAEDVATACISALISPQCATGIYAISGGETLSYQEMVGRVFDTLGRSRRMLRLPRGLLAPMLKLISCLPRFRHWTVGMVDRMERDLVFDHAEATRDFGFNPRTFVLTRRDLPG